VLVLPSIFLDLLVARSVSSQETLYVYMYMSTYLHSVSGQGTPMHTRGNRRRLTVDADAVPVLLGSVSSDASEEAPAPGLHEATTYIHIYIYIMCTLLYIYILYMQFVYALYKYAYL